MNTKRMLFSLVVSSAMTAAVFAATQLGPGKYLVSVNPQFDKQTAVRIEKGLEGMKQLASIDAKPADSSIHFKVKENARVDVAQLMDAVRTAVPDAQLSNPITDSNAPLDAKGSQMGVVRTTCHF